jgi:hypothetical protein
MIALKMQGSMNEFYARKWRFYLVDFFPVVNALY